MIVDTFQNGKIQADILYLNLSIDNLKFTI